MLFNYTTELRNYIEQYSDPSLPLSNRELIEAGRTQLFDFEYDIFDETYKKVFETHFIRKFYMRQIGFETFGLFKFQLETWLIINMPYYNKLFESELLQYDPLSNTKIDATYTKTSDKAQNDNRNVVDSKIIDGETTSNSNRNASATNTENSKTTNKESSNVNNMETGSKNTNINSSQTKDETATIIDDNFDRQLESANPDSRLELTAVDGEGVIEYANTIKENNENNSKTTTSNETNVNEDSSHEDSINESTLITENDSTATSANDRTSESNENMVDNTNSNINQNDTKNDILISAINNVEDFVEHRTGKIGVQSFAKLVQEYRASLMRIENKMFDEMNELFMLVY